MSRLRTEYIETGKVKFVYKHFAILGSESNRSAEASECAADQGAFWPYHDLVFADQATQRNTLDSTHLVSLAAELELDTDAFQRCLTNGQHSMTVVQETQLIGSLGVRGTPAFLVNGVFVSGAQPFEAFQEIIEDQLALLEEES